MEHTGLFIGALVTVYLLPGPDMLLILHADHEQNASTSTVRLCGSSGTNPFAAIAAGVGGMDATMIQDGRSRYAYAVRLRLPALFASNGAKLQQTMCACDFGISTNLNFVRHQKEHFLIFDAFSLADEPCCFAQQTR